MPEGAPTSFDPFDAVSLQTTDELVAAIAAYGFRDPHGHPLVMCAEFVELQRRFSGIPSTDATKAA